MTAFTFDDLAGFCKVEETKVATYPTDDLRGDKCYGVVYAFDASLYPDWMIERRTPLQRAFETWERRQGTVWA